MSTSANKPTQAMAKSTLVYSCVAVFFLVFFLIYDQFSHGVHSPYMTWLFGWPLLLGTLPCAVFWRIPQLRRPGWLSVRLYHSGVAALTVSSMLRGIFEIAGTASDYQQWLIIAGGLLLLGGVVAYFFKK